MLTYFSCGGFLLILFCLYVCLYSEWQNNKWFEKQIWYFLCQKKILYCIKYILCHLYIISIWILPFENFYAYSVCKIMFHQCIYLQRLSTFIHTILRLILYNTYNYSIKSWCPLTPSYKIAKNIIYVTRHDMWCWFQSISYTAQSFKQNVIAACQKISEKAVNQIISRRNHQQGKHMASTCSVSCSEFLSQLQYWCHIKHNK